MKAIGFIALFLAAIILIVAVDRPTAVAITLLFLAEATLSRAP